MAVHLGAIERKPNIWSSSRKMSPKNNKKKHSISCLQKQFQCVSKWYQPFLFCALIHTNFGTNLFLYVLIRSHFATHCNFLKAIKFQQTLAALSFTRKKIFIYKYVPKKLIQNYILIFIISCTLKYYINILLKNSLVYYLFYLTAMKKFNNWRIQQRLSFSVGAGSVVYRFDISQYFRRHILREEEDHTFGFFQLRPK